MHYASLFLDYENIYYYLKNNLEDRRPTQDLILRLTQDIREHVRSLYSENVIVSHAYADFDRAAEVEQSGLELIGVETHHVTGTDHKNAADMKLCIDAMELLYTRKDITTFVLVSGDRDYIPVIQHLKKHGRTVRVVALPQNISGDLLLNAGGEFFTDATQLLPKDLAWRRAEPPPPTPRPAGQAPPPVQTFAAALPSRPPAAVAAVRFSEVMEVEDTNSLRALRLMLNHFSGKHEIWMAPLLHRLRAEIPELADLDRKGLITRLEGAGAIKVEKRHGGQNDYAVVILNWNHPSVRGAN